MDARSRDAVPRLVRRLVRLPVNPMAFASAGLLLGAAALPWLGVAGLAVFGGLAFPVFGVQASLWDLAGPGAPIALDPIVPLLSGILIIVAGATVLWRSRLGMAVGAAAVLLFLGGTWGLPGTHSAGTALTIVVPGPGLDWAVAGIAAAAFSARYRFRSLMDLAGALRTARGLAQAGLFLAGVFLAIDAADHASGGNLLAVFGAGAAEEATHSLFIAAVAALAALAVLRPAAFQGRVGTALVGLAGVGLALDGVYHSLSGDFADFLGHTDAELAAHLVTYYGIAFLAIARFVLV